jgi:site-specific DNA-methyltransferase (adenine-specific)
VSAGRSKRKSETTLLQGDCLELLGGLKEASVDAIVTDPPYGIGIKGERWDAQAIQEAAARGGAGRMTRRKAFEVWCSMWGTECARVLKPGGHLLAFGSPRTAHRLAVGLEDAGLELRDTLCWLFGTGLPASHRLPGGRGTSLKPAYEPIVLCRRALEGTTAETIERHGTGALEVDRCRVERRHPANVLVGHGLGCTPDSCEPDCAVALLDGGTSHGRSVARSRPSRFFYCAKVSRREREAGCGDLPAVPFDLFPNAPNKPPRTPPTRNPHPTVKPLELMRWLVRLVTPPGGLVLDPFCGSGSTGAAAALERRSFLGIELSPEYLRIAAARISHWSPGDDEVKRAPLGGRR